MRGDPCELKACRSNEPAAVGVTENIGDGAWRTFICFSCAEALQVSEGDDLPSADDVESALTMRYVINA